MNYLLVGKIVNTHGIKGEVKLIKLEDDNLYKDPIFSWDNSLSIGTIKVKKALKRGEDKSSPVVLYKMEIFLTLKAASKGLKFILLFDGLLFSILFFTLNLNLINLFILIRNVTKSKINSIWTGMSRKIKENNKGNINSKMIFILLFWKKFLIIFKKG